MGDLIERKESIEAIKKYGKDAISAGRKHIDPVDDIIELCNMLAALPAVEAAPVVHAHWIYHPDDLFPAESKQECSYCHVEETMYIRNEKFCPNCGAKMGGEGDVKCQN